MSPELSRAGGLQRQTSRLRLRCSAIQGGGWSPEQALKSTVELDRFIDKLLMSDTKELPVTIAENVFAFDRNFWLRLATRAESCQSEEDKADMQDLANVIMVTVEKLVQATNEKIEESTSVLEDVLRVVADEDGEMRWPMAPQRIADLKEVIHKKQLEGFLDEGFLAEVSAQLRQAKEKGDRPGLVALLQKVLQLYAASWLSQRSYARKPDGSEDQTEKLLEDVITAEEEDWESLVRDGLTYGGGSVTDSDLAAALEKRMERMLMRTEGGSYQQRVLGEYLNEIEGRVLAMVEAFNSAAA